MSDNIKNMLQERLKNEDNALFQYVITDLLEKDDVVGYIKDVLKHGCISGVVSRLIYYADTHKFYDNYYNEIEDLRLELLEQGINMLEYIGENDFKNHMAWMAYEESLRQIAEDLEVLM